MTVDAKRVEVTRIAEGLGATGRLGRDPIERTGRALDRFARALREDAIGRAAAVATGAFRIAENRDDAVARLSDRLGVPIVVVGGEREAALARRGIRGAPGGAEPLAMLDIGGTSTEIAVGSLASSVPTGVVNLSEACAAARPDDPEAWLRREAERVVARLATPADPPAVWFAAGGAAVALAARREGEGLLTFTGDRTDPIDRSALAAEYAAFRAEDREARAARLGITVAHADLIPAGWALLEALLDRFDIPLLRPTGRGVAEGLLAETLEDPTP
ncbi:MAG: diol dehydratase reactivase ATPase-like domain-containing protein [Planctomycetota bacterium JB042]